MTVIVPTTVSAERRGSLLRALTSLSTQQVTPLILVIANGPSCDEPTLADVRRMANVSVIRSAIGSYPLAQRLGREHVETPFFCFLDDDDELLPTSISIRLKFFDSNPEASIVVSNGFRRLDGADALCIRALPSYAAAPDDILISLLEANWFGSSSPLMRTEKVTADFFDGETKYLEWTLLAFKLVRAGLRFGFVDEPGFRLHDTPGSLSKSSDSVFLAPSTLARLMALTPSSRVRSALRVKVAHAHHACADVYMQQRQLAPALKHHLASVASPSGWVFLSFTRHLIYRFFSGAGHP